MEQKDASVQVAVIGLGKMGSALAEVLLERGIEVTIWNRTPARCERLAGMGARVAGSVAEAAGAADLMIVCVTDHATSCAVLMTDDVARALAGKMLVQVSTITMQQSSDLAEWAREHHIEYLDGAISSRPQRVLEGNCPVVYSGSRRLFEVHADVFAAMGGHPKFVGERPGTALALETAGMSCAFGFWLDYFHGAAMCHALGLPIEMYVDKIAAWLSTMIPTMRHLGESIARRDYENPSATLETYVAAQRHVVDLSEALGIDVTPPKLTLGYFERGVAAGYSQQELSALFELMIKRDE